MRKGLVFLLLLITTLSEAQEIDVLHYNFTISLGDESDSIIGISYITFVMKADVAAVSFDLANVRPDGKGMQVSTVTDATKEGKPLSFSHQNNQLTIQLKQAKKNDTCSVMISYQGVPGDGLIIARNKFGERTFFGDNWPNRAHNWLPCVDRPDDKASVRFEVVAPAHYKVVANGIKKEETSHGMRTVTTWFQDVPIPTKVMVFGAAHFIVKSYNDSPPGLPVSAWVYPQDSVKGVYDFALAPSIVRFFADYVAPLPFKKLANVQSTTIFGGMENASCIFYAENLVTGDRSIEETIAHEIAHQWFGDMASEKSFAHLWLSEGFATYMTNLYFEKVHDREAFVERLQNEREEVIDFVRRSESPVVDSSANLMSLLNANSYQKGGWVLHMLRTEVGDSAFHEIIKTYYNTYKGGNAETRDFEAVAESVSGKNLKWFFDQWLYRPGVPRLKIKKTITTEGIRLTIAQLQKDLYRLTLPVLTSETASEKNTIRLIDVNERIKTVLLTKDKHAKIIIDPSTTVLYEEVK